MDPTRRDWDAIVVGLGGIGSGAAYWLSRALGEGVLGLERFELDHVNGASADHSRIIRLSYHRPDYVRLAKRAYETWAEVEAGGRRADRHRHRRARPVAGRPGHPDGRLHGQPDRGGGPVRAARRRRGAQALAAVAGRRRAARRCGSAQGGLADPFRGNAAHRRLARANGATLRDRSAGDVDPRRGRRRPRGGDRRTRRTGRGGSCSPPTPGPTSCSPRSIGACR